MGIKLALIIVVLLVVSVAGFLFLPKTFKKKMTLNKTFPAGTIRYIPIGDSYTIGEGLSANQTWPFLLTEHLKAEKINIELLQNPAVTGWTTQQAINNELPLLAPNNVNFSTVLIGVNDQFQGQGKVEFRINLTKLLDEMEKIIPDKKILLITIPNYLLSPSMRGNSDGATSSKELQDFNAIIKLEAGTRGLPVVDIYPLSQQVATDESMFTPDGLHPSAKQVQLWEELIYPEALKMLK